MINMLKKVACFVPGVGAPVSLYYTFTSKELRSTALKGLFILPASVIVLGMTSMASVPVSVLWLAGAYIYWGILALAAGWGFLAMLIAWRAIEKVRIEPIQIEAESPEKEEIQELIPSASVSEVIPDLDADEIISGVERLSDEKKRELLKKLIQEIE